MKESVRKEIEDIIKVFKLDCSVEEFRDDELYSIAWFCMIRDRDLSEDFIKEFMCSFKDWAWQVISEHQNLSKDFIYEMKDYLDEEILEKRGFIEIEKIDNRFEILDL